MIVLDPSEARYVTPHLHRGLSLVLHPIEADTGADMVLSTWEAPATTTTLIEGHIRRGTGYQLKRGMDLPASVFDGRLMDQLVKMREHWEIPWAVHIASVSIAMDGETVIDDDVSHGRRFPFKSYISTMRNWQRAGGGWITVPERHFGDWVADELRRLALDCTERLICRAPVKLIPLTDQEETLVTLPRIGPQTAHLLWESLEEPTLARVFSMLVDGTAAQLPGIGKMTCQRIAQYLGVEWKKERLGVMRVVQARSVEDAVRAVEAVFYKEEAEQ